MITLLEENKINKTQKEVDFLIPFLDTHRRFFLDPSLLRFTETKHLKAWNEEISEFLKLVHRVMKSGDIPKLKRLLNIGEATDAGFGYCGKGVNGSGMGKEISGQVIKILSTNPEFKKRGFLRLEELQWLDKNIGPDRICDLTVNILKRHIIAYTQQQCKKHKIPMEDVRVQKVFEPNSMEWIAIKTKMPVNPYRKVRDTINQHPPVLLIPKEIMKPLPFFLNYDDFYGFIDPDYEPGKSARKSKSSIVEEVISNPIKSKDFITTRENKTDHLYRQDFDSDIQRKIEILEGIKPGNAGAAQYRDVVAEILEFIFDDISLYKKEKPSIGGEVRRDMIFRNNAVVGIFSDLLFRQ